jgi:hypothetical protein
MFIVYNVRQRCLGSSFRVPLQFVHLTLVDLKGRFDPELRSMAYWPSSLRSGLCSPPPRCRAHPDDLLAASPRQAKSAKMTQKEEKSVRRFLSNRMSSTRLQAREGPPSFAPVPRKHSSALIVDGRNCVLRIVADIRTDHPAFAAISLIGFAPLIGLLAFHLQCPTFHFLCVQLNGYS